MANCGVLVLTFATVVGVFGNSAYATSCPFCVGVVACGTNQTIRSVTCDSAVVNQTVVQLGQFFKNLTQYTAPAKQYRCIKVEFNPPYNPNKTFAVQGCTSGTKSVCSEPTWEFNGNLTCVSRSNGPSLHDLRHGFLTGLLVNMAVILGAFALSN